LTTEGYRIKFVAVFLPIHHIEKVVFTETTIQEGFVHKNIPYKPVFIPSVSTVFVDGIAE
jgi:hypothetical protein